jgi:hypothetical protein
MMNVQHTSTETLMTPACTAQAKIDALDLEPVKFKLMKEKSWTLQRADRVEKLYKTYLALFAAYPGEEHVPTAEIDEMWHAHILDTQKYIEDCQDIFGFYLHHYPYLGLLGGDEAQAAAGFARTRERFLAIGLDPAQRPDLQAASCGGGGCGGSCGGSGCGSSCGGHGCCGDGGSTGGDGQGSGHCPSTPATNCSGATIGGCGGYVGGRKKRKEDEDGKAKIPFWRRIWGVADEASSRPLPRRRRPGRAEVLQVMQQSVMETLNNQIE